MYLPVGKDAQREFECSIRPEMCPKEKTRLSFLAIGALLAAAWVAGKIK